MDVIGERTAHVFCRSAANGGSGDPSIHTALGVFHGIRATLAHAFGTDDPAGRTVLVQGTGSVGAKLARLLLDAGAIVLVSDVDEERARATGGQPRRIPTPRSSSSATSTRPARSARRSTPTRSRSSAAASSPAERTTSSRRPRTASACARRGSSTRPTT